MPRARSRGALALCARVPERAVAQRAHALVATAAQDDGGVDRDQPVPEVSVTSVRRKLERQQRKKQGAARSGGQPSKVTEVQLRELEAILARAKAGPLGDAEVDKLQAAMDTLAFLTRELEAKGASIQRLRRMLFGPSTEKTSQVVGSKQGAAARAATEDTSSSAPSDVAQDNASSPVPAADVTPPLDATPAPDTDAPAADSSATEPKRKGHGRNPAAAYTGASKVSVPHESLHDKETCPECQRGKVYVLPPPAQLVRVRGMAPLLATIYELERLRCNLCGEVFTAQAPDGVGSEKYDETASSMIALLKYGSGLPWNRLERLQQGFGIPLPASTQWEVVRDAARRYDAVYFELIHQAADGQVIYNDDTTMKVLELEDPERRKELDTDGDFEGRTGVFTSGIVSTKDQHQIALFFTGQKHAGENLADLLAQRNAELSAPIQMCDGLSRNLPDDFATLLARCNAHARRKFIDVESAFPDEVRHVLETVAQVYRNDAFTKQRDLSAEERLRYHQTESAPLLEGLKKWFAEQFEARTIEPNSTLGDAIEYMTKHWDALTLFLRVPGAPLDNNLCERVLKKAILHRKTALFYKTLNGARVGDLFMSIIHTAELAKINVFDYLVALQRHHERVVQDPAAWMPWNYSSAFAQITEPDPPT
jgi:transposase